MAYIHENANNSELLAFLTAFSELFLHPDTSDNIKDAIQRFNTISGE